MISCFCPAARAGIVGDAIQPDAWAKIQLKEAEMNKVPQMFVDTTPQQAPVFTTHLVNHDKLAEGQHVLLEAQVSIFFNYPLFVIDIYCDILLFRCIPRR